MKYKIAFVCIHNSARSQMAEGFAKHLGADILESYSAGTEEYPEIKPFAVKVMEEIGIPIKNQYPKLLKEIPEDIDILITMGCGVVCPYMPVQYEEDWGLDDPSGGSIKDFRETRNLIENKVKDLIERIKKRDIIIDKK
ncbi:MAG: arsenate reductase ArsC [Clostridium sp.]|nr:arsenate reductase ArsC [Clostridium sp.]